MSDDNAPHRQAYFAVLESQAAARDAELNSFRSTGQHAVRTDPGHIGALLGMFYCAFHFHDSVLSVLFGLVLGISGGGFIVGRGFAWGFKTVFYRIPAAIIGTIYRFFKASKT